MSFELFVSIMMQCLICVLWKLITSTWTFVRCLITWSCCLWASQCNAHSVYVSVTCTYRAITALSMRLFSSSDKHSLQKIRSQHLVQINLVIDCIFCKICEFSVICFALIFFLMFSAFCWINCRMIFSLLFV